MTGVQIVGIAVISLVVIFLVAEYFMANFMATYILTPSSKLCPTPEQTPDFPDWKGDFENSVQKEKEAYIREHRLTVWRDHDHMHTHQPDSIFTGVIKYLGWESYFNTEISGMMPFFLCF